VSSGTNGSKLSTIVPWVGELPLLHDVEVVDTPGVPGVPTGGGGGGWVNAHSRQGPHLSTTLEGDLSH